MKPETDADMLFRRSGSAEAQRLHKEAKKLLRQRDRKAFWDGRKGDKREN